MKINVCNIGKGSIIHNYLLNELIVELKFNQDNYETPLLELRERTIIYIYCSKNNFNNSFFINYFKPIFRMVDIKKDYYFIELDQFIGFLIEGKSPILFELIFSNSIRNTSLSFLYDIRDKFISKNLILSYFDLIFNRKEIRNNNQSSIYDRYISLLILFKLLECSENYSFTLNVGNYNIPKTKTSIKKSFDKIKENCLGKEISTLRDILDTPDLILKKINDCNLPESLIFSLSSEESETNENSKFFLQLIERRIRGMKEELFLVNPILDTSTENINLDIKNLNISLYESIL